MASVGMRSNPRQCLPPYDSILVEDQAATYVSDRSIDGRLMVAEFVVKSQISEIVQPSSCNAPEMKSNNRMYTSSGFRTAVRVSNVSVNLHPDYRRVLRSEEHTS